MNCCDANGKCTGGAGCAARSVDQVDGGALKVGETRFGQQPLRAPLLAPGMVEGYRGPVFLRAAQRRELRRWLVVALAWMAVWGLGGLAAGMVAGVWP